ncbi:MAG: hypothetical protein ACLQM8_23520 [Limisphaerales bacterium]
MKPSVLIHHRGVRTAAEYLLPALLVGAVVYRATFRSMRVNGSTCPRIQHD